MIYTVENDAIRVGVEDKGAQMASLVLKETGREYLWQGCADYWPDRAYNLFPICGRLWDGKYTLDGREYRMDIHGFAKDSMFRLAEKDETHMAFEMNEDKRTLEQYPFRFLFRAQFDICGNEVRVRYTVRDTDDKDLIFTVGGHPGFNMPLDPDGTFGDCTLTFAEDCRPRKVRINDRGYMLGGTEAWDLPDGRSLALSHGLFDRDAIFLTDIPDSVTLRQGKTGRFVTVTYPDMPYLGLWHTPRTQAPFLCIEPWAGLPADDGAVDDLRTKSSMARIAPGEEKAYSYSIAIG